MSASAGRFRNFDLPWRAVKKGAQKGIYGTRKIIRKSLGRYPLVICYIAIEHGPVEIVDLPIKNGDFPYSYVNVYQRVLPLNGRCCNVELPVLEVTVCCFVV